MLALGCNGQAEGAGAGRTLKKKKASPSWHMEGGTFLNSLLHWPSGTAAPWNQATRASACAGVCAATRVRRPTEGGAEVWRPGHPDRRELWSESTPAVQFGHMARTVKAEKENTEEKRCHRETRLFVQSTFPSPVACADTAIVSLSRGTHT